jgi:hypothetical protein
MKRTFAAASCARSGRLKHECNSGNGIFGNLQAVRKPTPGRGWQPLKDGDRLAEALQRQIADFFEGGTAFDRNGDASADQNLSVLGFATSNQRWDRREMDSRQVRIERYRREATNLRAKAETFYDSAPRQQLLDIARDYETLARSIEMLPPEQKRPFLHIV